MCLNFKKTRSSRWFKRILGNENYINKLKKGFLGKATGRNDHHMVNMGGQMSKIIIINYN